MTYSTKDKLDEVLREINYRKHVYPRMIDQQKLSEAAAKRRVAIMWEIANDLDAQLKRERLL